jgi:hypothetical protein
MSEFVTATPSIAGFVSGHENHGYYHNAGINGKDQQFAVSIDHGHQTRELLSTIRHNEKEMHYGFKEVAKEFCDVKREIYDVKATVLAVEATRIKDALIRAQNELLAARVAGITPPVIS